MVVSGRSTDFAAVANQIETLDPTFVRSFLSGLEAAVKAGASMPWDQPIRLMASVLEQPFEHEEDTSALDRDLGWRWTRGQAASLIETGVADRDNGVPFELRRRLELSCRPLTRDPVHRYTSSASFYRTRTPSRSRSTRRGNAMHAVMAAHCWCRRELVRPRYRHRAGIRTDPRGANSARRAPQSRQRTVRGRAGRLREMAALAHTARRPVGRRQHRPDTAAGT